MARIRLHLFYWALIAAVIAATATLTRSPVRSTSDSAVYLIGAVTVTDPERLPRYQAIAGPLAGEIAAYQPLAFAAPQMIEGDPPTPGSYFVERYESLAGLQAFLGSPKFQQAKVLRDQVADVHFMLWIPALPVGSLPH